MKSIENLKIIIILPFITKMHTLCIKKSLFHLNINTVTYCETMCSRRLIELLGCGCNVYSNTSKSIDYLKLPVVKEISNMETYFTEYNIDGFYLTHY